MGLLLAALQHRSPKTPASVYFFPAFPEASRSFREKDSSPHKARNQRMLNLLGECSPKCPALWRPWLKSALKNKQIVIYLFICSHWKLVVVPGLSLVVVPGLLIAVASLVAEHWLQGVWASGVAACGLNSCGSWALEHQLNSRCSIVVSLRLSCSEACGIFPERGWTCVPCVGMQILSHWTTREVLKVSIYIRSWMKKWVSVNKLLFFAINCVT